MGPEPGEKHTTALPEIHPPSSSRTCQPGRQLLTRARSVFGLAWTPWWAAGHHPYAGPDRARRPHQAPVRTPACCRDGPQNRDVPGRMMSTCDPENDKHPKPRLM